MRHRPYTLLGENVLAALRGAFDAAVDGWCRDWGVARDEIIVECLRAWEGAAQLPAAPAWRAPWQSHERGLAVAWPDALPAHMPPLLFGADRPHAPAAGGAHTAAAAGAAAWQALLGALAQAAVPGAAVADHAMPPAADDWRYASGALLLVVRVGRQVCHAVLNAAAVAGHAGATAPDAPLAAVDYPRLLARQPVLLAVTLGQARVDLGSLLQLNVGDVIRLDTAADRALPVRAPGAAAAVLFGGYLGRRGDDMALELAPNEIIKGVKHER